MCRAVVEGGRRCPCTRGDRRRAYQRLRYAARQAATAAVGEHTTATVDDPSSAEPSSLEQRCAETAAAVDEALTALRDADRSGDPDVHEAYLNAVLDHGAVLRDIADQKIERAYAAPHRRDRARALRKVGIGCPDGFSDRYMGKDYAGTHHTELFSCGMEAITHGRFGGLTGRPSIFLPAPVASPSPTAPSRQKPTPSTWPSSSDCWPQPTNASREPGTRKHLVIG